MKSKLNLKFQNKQTRVCRTDGDGSRFTDEEDHLFQAQVRPRGVPQRSQRPRAPSGRPMTGTEISFLALSLSLSNEGKDVISSLRFGFVRPHEVPRLCGRPEGPGPHRGRLVGRRGVRPEQCAIEEKQDTFAKE